MEVTALTTGMPSSAASCTSTWPAYMSGRAVADTTRSTSPMPRTSVARARAVTRASAKANASSAIMHSSAGPRDRMLFFFTLRSSAFALLALTAYRVAPASSASRAAASMALRSYSLTTWWALE